MHAVRFAIGQGRRVLWPHWPALLLDREGFSGNKQAVAGCGQSFDGDDYDGLAKELQAWQARSLEEPMPPASGEDKATLF